MKKLSIKEKSEEYGYHNWQSDEYHDGAREGLPFDAIGHTQKTFEAGANYAIAKSVEWLKDFCNEHYIMSYADSSEVDTKELIKIFKKKMWE